MGKTEEVSSCRADRERQTERESARQRVRKKEERARMGGIITAPLSMASACLGSCAATCACSACKTCVNGLSSVSRFAYFMLFTLSIFLSWIFRDYAQGLMKKIPWIDHFGVRPSDEWFGKLITWLVFNIVPFFLPNESMEVYSAFARF